MQVPVVGNEAFVREWVESKMGVIRRGLQGIAGLSSKHVALYLLKGAGDACRVVYYLRTTPQDFIKPFIEDAPALIVVFKQVHDTAGSTGKKPNYYVNESVGIAVGMLLTALHRIGLVALTHTPSPMR